MCQINENIDLQGFFDTLSEPRLRTYRTTFKPATDRELLGAYLWGQAVGAAFQPFISLAEVALRNAIHTSLSLRITNNAQVSYPWYDRNAVNSLQLTGKTSDAVEDILCDKNGVRLATQPTPDAVVSDLSFGIWPDILASQLPVLRQAQTFLDTFPTHPHSKLSHWSRPERRAEVVAVVKKLQRLRNRVSHFEPVWSPTMLLTAHGRHWSHAVQALALCHREFVELLGWISEPSMQVYSGSFAGQWLRRLVSTNAVKAYMHDPFSNGHLAELVLPPPPPAEPAAIVLPAA